MRSLLSNRKYLQLFIILIILYIKKNYFINIIELFSDKIKVQIQSPLKITRYAKPIIYLFNIISLIMYLILGIR